MPLREFSSVSEMMMFYRELRQRMENLQPPPPKPKPLPPPPPPEPKPEPQPPPRSDVGLSAFQKIVIAVCSEFEIAPHMIKSNRRAQALIHPRHAIMYLAHKLLPTMSLPMIGRAIGHRDHTTVLSAIRRFPGKMQFDRDLAERVERVHAHLQKVMR